MNEFELIIKPSSLTKFRKSKKYKSFKKNYISGLSKNKFFPKKIQNLIINCFYIINYYNYCHIYKKMNNKK